jgi:hypothetical protein
MLFQESRFLQTGILESSKAQDEPGMISDGVKAPEEGDSEA